jgi:hypothetical protein
MQVRVFGLEEQSRMRGLDPKVRTVCACNVKYRVGTGFCYCKFPRAVLGYCFVSF